MPNFAIEQFQTINNIQTVDVSHSEATEQLSLLNKRLPNLRHLKLRSVCMENCSIEAPFEHLEELSIDQCNVLKKTRENQKFEHPKSME